MANSLGNCQVLIVGIYIPGMWFMLLVSPFALRDVRFFQSQKKNGRTILLPRLLHPKTQCTAGNQTNPNVRIMRINVCMVSAQYLSSVRTRHRVPEAAQKQRTRPMLLRKHRAHPRPTEWASPYSQSIHTTPPTCLIFVAVRKYTYLHDPNQPINVVRWRRKDMIITTVKRVSMNQ